MKIVSGAEAPPYPRESGGASATARAAGGASEMNKGTFLARHPLRC